MTSYRLAAPAKINLLLRVTGRREDGFHELVSIFQGLDFADQLSLRCSAEPGARLTLENAPDLDAGPGNLVMRALMAYGEAAQLEGGLECALKKHIPLAGGLGGGSSDAAAALRLAETAQEGALGVEKLYEVAASLGSDVPFFLRLPTALARGRGERLRRLAPPARPLWVVLAVPPFGCSTPEVYRRLEGRFTQAAQAEAEARQLAEALALGASAAELAPLLANDLQAPALEVAPGLGDLIELLEECGAPRALVSGSGSTVFALVDSSTEASRLVNQALSAMPQTSFIVTSTLASAPEVIVCE